MRLLYSFIGLYQSPATRITLPVIEEPRSKLRGMFCLKAVLRIDRKEFCLILIRSLTPQHAKHCRTAEPAGNALAFSVQFRVFQNRVIVIGHWGQRIGITHVLNQPATNRYPVLVWQDAVQRRGHADTSRLMLFADLYWRWLQISCRGHPIRIWKTPDRV